VDDRDVETYYEDGVWKNRRGTTGEPFSTGDSLRRQVAIGAEVARWAQSKHLIRDAEGNLVEINIYGSGPYPPRSPIKTVRYTVESPTAVPPDHS
jgi:hypothetical protein